VGRVTEVDRLVSMYRAMADAHPALVWAADTTGACTHFNASWLAFRGRTTAEEVGDGWVEGVHPDDRDRCVGTYREAFDRRVPFEMEYRLQRHDGAYRWIRDVGAPWSLEDGTFAGYVGSCIDVTDHRDRERQLVRHANEDPLTGVANRRALVDAVAAAGERGALLFVDLDGFKRVNDCHGHTVGDEVLVATARRLEHAVRADDVVVRVGGDEFGVVTSVAAEELDAVVDRIVSAFVAPVQTSVGPIQLQLSVGVARVGVHGGADQALRRADERMYERKRRVATPCGLASCTPATCATDRAVPLRARR